MPRGASAEQAPVIGPPVEFTTGLEPISPWKDSDAVLEQFLAATSLAERLPLIESKTPEAKLALGCLAAALPPVRKWLPEFRESDKTDHRLDCYYTVEFGPDDKPVQAQTVLVRTRGTNPPKVMADPFLDTFGGRLAAYAAAPVARAEAFQVVVYAVASCTDPNIPDRGRKMTLKLLACDNRKEIARAYFARQSEIGGMLEEGNHPLGYGNSKACTVVLRWNFEDDPAHPFLEAQAITDFDWNS